ncbi:Neurochondrin [Balamuthia mandrillaris]
MTTTVDLGKCLSLLRAPSDEEKFVGLLLVTKFVQRPTPSVLHQIAEAIGFPFLHRLLRSKQGEGTFSYQDLALSILSTFAAEAELASHPQYLATVPLLLSIINAEGVADGTKLEALKCLLGVAQTAAGLSALLSYEALPKIALSIFEADPKDERLSLTFQLFETVLRHSHQQLHLQHHPQEERFALTLRDFEQKGAMHHLSCLFRQNQQSFKFALLQRLNLLMSYFRDCKEAIKEEEDENEERERWKWKEDIRIGLNDILTSKLGRAQRDMAFVLCAHMLHRFGQEWALGPPLHFVASKEETEEKVKKREAKGKDRTEVFSTEAKTTTSLEEKGRFVEVLVLLVCVEAQFLLETTVLHPDRYRPSPASLTLSPSTAPLSITSSSPTDSTHDPCSSSSSEENYNVDMISVCYDIVEQVIYYLSHSPMESTAQQKQTKKRYWSEELPSPVLSSIQRGLSDVFTVIVQYLRKCKDEQDEAPVLSQPTKTKDSILLVATIRLLGVWLSEETSALRSEILEVLPFLLQQSFDRTRTNEEKEGDQMFSFLLPGLLHLTSEKDARGIFLGNNGPALLLSYIKRHYPSFCSVVVNSGSLGGKFLSLLAFYFYKLYVLTSFVFLRLLFFSRE